MKHRRLALFSVILLLLVWTSRASTTDTTLVAKGAAWKYLDDGSDQGTAWQTPTFADGAWPSGPAQLGYGDGDEATVVSFGPNASAKYITTYFRHSFTVGDPSLYQSITLNLLRDDGAIVYLNGAEVARSNMPSGPVTSTTPASVAIGGTDEATYYAFSISPSQLVAGTNVLAVEVHQANGTSTDVSFDAELIASTTLQTTRGPYLQMGTSSSVVVRWRTSSASDSQVRYGPDPSSLIWSATDGALTTEHEIALSSLTPATRYYYSVGSTTATLSGADANHFFDTPPVTGSAAPTRIWVLGDSGTKDANARAVRDAYDAFTGATHTNLWLMLGDNAYEQGLDNEFQAAVFDMYPAMLRKSVLWPTLGNHDGAAANSSTGTGPYYDIFTLPKQGEAGGLASGTEAYYSFDYANIHFICLESFETSRAAGGAMMTWLQNDLASTTQPWIVAFFHHPPYSKGSHDSDIDLEMREMRENALPILEAGGVDLVMTGHSHSYERSYLIDGHYGLSGTFTAGMKKDGGNGREDGTGAYQKPTFGPAPHEGAVYAVAGSSGKISGGTFNHPAMFVSMNVLGSMVLDVNGDRLDARFIDNLGATRDYFTLRKGTAAPAITTGTLPDGTMGAAYSTALQATGGAVPYAWSLATGQLPAGLSLDANSGAISGTPSGPGGTSTFDARVTGNNGQSSTRTLSIRIESALSITTASLPDGTAGTAYSQTASATGGSTPYAWSLASGSLPAGLSLDAGTGTIAGTPTAAGASSFTLQASDSGAPPRVAQRALSITIAAPPQLPGTFHKLSPKNASKLTGTGVTLTWSASSGATSYQYCYDTTNNNACNSSWLSAGAGTQTSIAGLAPNTTYYWQIRAVNGAGTTLANGGAPGWWKFTTPR